MYASDYFFCVLLSTGWVWFVFWFCELSKESILYLSFFYFYLFISFFSHVFVCYGEWICDAVNCMLWFFFCVLLSTDWVWFVVWFCELVKSLYYIWVFIFFFGRCLYVMVSEFVVLSIVCMILIIFCILLSTDGVGSVS